MILFICIFSLILRLISLNQSFWLDETAQAVISSHNLLNVNWNVDFSPPFFYIMTHIWQSFGIRSEWFLRLLPLFFGVATIYLSYYLFKRLFNEKVALVSAVLLATAPYHIYYSHEYRMYSFLGFIAILSWIFLWERKWALYGITILIGIFSHYFAFFIIASHIFYIIVARRGEWKKYTKTLFLSLFPFLGWSPIFIHQLDAVRGLIHVWPQWKSVSGVSFYKFPFILLAKFTVGQISPPQTLYILAVLIVGIIFIISLFRLFRQSLQPSRLESVARRPNVKYSILNTQYFLLFSYFFVPVIIVWIGGLWVSANGPWRLIFVLPAFYGIIAVGLTMRIKAGGATGGGPKQGAVSPKARSTFWDEGAAGHAKIIVIFLLMLNIFFSFYYLLNSASHREDWREAIQYTDQKLEAGGLVLTEYYGPWAPMEWYSHRFNRYKGASTSPLITQQSIDDKLRPYLPTTDHFLLYTYLQGISDPSHNVETYLTQQGYILSEEKDFRGVGIIKTFSKPSF